MNILFWVVIVGFAILISPVLEKHEANKRKLEAEKKLLEEEEEKERQKSYKEFLTNWLEGKGKQYEKSSGYPNDWKIRKQAVLIRDDFSCQICGENFYSSFVDNMDWEGEFFNPDGGTVNKPDAGYLCHGAHIHHIVKVSKGGTHELENLQLLCESCHTKQEGHKALHRRVKTDAYYRTYTRNNKLKKARTTHVCDICELTINPGEIYFGGYYKDRHSYGRFGESKESKICFDCYKRYDYRSKYST